MSASPPSIAPARHELKELPVSAIEVEDNPREVFPESELQRLAESIAEAGVLVPLVVYEDPEDGGFKLIDGERRFRCARTLGLEKVPALVVGQPDEVTRLTHMFNIHLVREPWQDIPTARALKRYIDATGFDDDDELSDKLGLSVERVRQLRHALELPPVYQEYIHDGSIPLNFFWELKKHIIDPLARQRPTLNAEFGKDEVLHAFVEKRRKGVVTDTVSLRKVGKIIRAARVENEETGSDDTIFDRVLRDLVRRQEADVDQAYDQTLAAQAEFSTLQNRVSSMVSAFERAYNRFADPDKRKPVRELIETFVARLQQIIR